MTHTPNANKVLTLEIHDIWRNTCYALKCFQITVFPAQRRTGNVLRCLEYLSTIEILQFVFDRK